MKWLVAGIVATVALFFVIESAVGIECYECNSYFQKTCADWFDNKTYHLVKCPEGVTMCRKIVQEVYYNKEYHTRYIRQCAPSGEVGGDEGRECQERTGTYRVKMRYCHCDNQDGCNGAEHMKLSLLAMILPALTTFWILLRKL